jgi:hypothetical protein
VRRTHLIVKDHSQASNELKQIASLLQVQPPRQLDQKHRDLADRLSKLQGAEFDREYLNAMVQGHEEVVNKLRMRLDAAARIGSGHRVRGRAYRGGASRQKRFLLRHHRSSCPALCRAASVR